MRLSSVLCLLIFLLQVSSVYAVDKVIVIPMKSVAEGLKNIVTVSAQGGDFTDPVAAVNSISDASESNPYLVFIGPGTYVLSETLVMKPYVTVAGAGQGVTTLSAIITEILSVTVSGATNTILRDLTVKHDANGGSSSNAIGSYAHDFAVFNVTAIAVGGNNNTAIINSEGTLTLVNVTASAIGGVNNKGVYSFAGDITLDNVVASSSGGTNINYGIYNYWSGATIKNSIVSATGGTISYGIQNNYYSGLSIKNSSISVSNASDSNVGVLNSESKLKITNVEITANKGQNTLGVDVKWESMAELTDVIISATEGSLANYGVRSREWCSLTLFNVITEASSGSSSYGAHITGEDSTAIIRRSNLAGSTNGLFCDAPAIATVSQSTIIGGGGGGTGTRTCVTSDNGSGILLDSGCL